MKLPIYLYSALLSFILYQSKLQIEPPIKSVWSLLKSFRLNYDEPESDFEIAISEMEKEKYDFEIVRELRKKKEFDEGLLMVGWTSHELITIKFWTLNVEGWNKLM